MARNTIKSQRYERHDREPSHRRITRPGRGFTLVELLAATALAAVLTVAILKIVVALGHEKHGATRSTFDIAEQSASSEVLNLVMRDLRNASSVTVSDPTNRGTPVELNT